MIELRWKHKAVGLSQTADFVSIEVETPAGVFEMQADWLVACDVANSGVRRMVGAYGAGRIVNPTERIQRVPQIQAELRDGQGRLVYGWAISAPVAELPPGASATFNSAEVDVPRGAKALNLSFGQPS